LLHLHNYNDLALDTCPTESFLSDIKIHLEPNRLYIISEIKQNSQLLGWLYISSDLSIINSRFHDQLIFSGISLLSVLVLAWLFAN